MAFKYFIYSTGTTYAGTIVRESATNNPGANEASFYDDSIIPEIQPVFLWRVDDTTTPTDIIPNTDENIRLYSEAIAPPPSPDDLVTYGQLTGITENKIDVVTGATDNIAIFTADGNLQDGGYTIPELTGLTTYTFVGSGGTIVNQVGNNVTISSTVPTGTTVTWGNIVGTLSDQTDLQEALDAKLDESVFTGYTATTDTRLQDIEDDLDLIEADITGLTTTKLDTSVFNSYTGTSQPILDAALTGVTNLGTGTTLGSVSGRNVTLKSISVLGGLSLSGDADNLIISGQTGGAGTITGATRGLSVYGADIGLGGNIDTNTTITINPNRSLRFTDTGTTFSVTIGQDSLNIFGDDSIFSVQNDVQIKRDSFASFYANSAFNCYTNFNQDLCAVTLCAQNTISGNNAGIQVCNNGRIIANGYSGFAGIEYLADYSANFGARSLVDAAYVTGLTSGLSAQIANKLDISTFNTYTGATETRIGDLEDDVTELFNESLINITGATNGLSKSGSKDVKLGGTLTEDTVISGLTNDFTINVDNITLQSVGSINLIDANGVGGINLESDGGVVKLQGNNAGSTPVTKIEVGETTLLITDDRGTPRGIQYAANYGSTFQNRSLVDKEYVDSVATGLIPKANVLVTTTGDITLSGTQTIDGIAVIAGNRVLVKDQDDATENGIYIVTGGTWSRSTDFDGTPDGEVSDGNLIPVLSGNTYGNTLWVLVTPNPITVGSDELEFTLFSSPLDLQAGVGIGITGQTIAVDGASLAGNSIVWSGNTFNVDITSGTLGQALTDIENDITGLTATKLNISTFNTYTGATETRLGNIEDDIEDLQSDITGLTATKLDVSVFNTYTGATDTLLDGIEDDIDYISGVTDNNFSIFTGYTASTVTNQIQLIHTGGTNINNVASTGIVWHSVTYSGSSFTWTGGTDIKINKTADYEVSYHVPHGHSGSNNIRGIASNLVVNGVTILNNTAGASTTARAGIVGSLSLPNTILSLNNNDVLNLIAFRTGLGGTSNTASSGVILIKEKNKLQ